MTLDLDPRCRAFWHHTDAHQLIPLDDAAEITVAGCAVVHEHSARLAVDRLAGCDFHDPARWSVITIAATDLPDGLPVEARVDIVAGIADMPRAWVQALVDRRCVMADVTGWHAHRVFMAAEARRRIGSHLAELDRLGVDLNAFDAGTHRQRWAA